MSTLRRSELALVLALLAALVPAAARADEDALAPYRGRFRQGMEKYKAGAMAEAIRTWSAIYEEIGPQRGYRLSFNLARAYEANSETTRAAERYRSFLDEVAVRRASGEPLDPIVDREATEAEARLGELDARSGRVRVVPGGRTVLTQIDAADPRLGTFTSYVAPGDHVVLFAPGSSEQERLEVTVKAGQIVVVSPTPPPPPIPPEPAPEPPRPAIPPEPPPPAHRLELVHPFSPVVLYVSAGAALLSAAVPIAAYAHAASLGSSYYAPGTMLSDCTTLCKPTLYGEYATARTVAYATLAIPLGLSVVTGGLATFYFARSKERLVTVGGSVWPGGGAALVEGAF